MKALVERDFAAFFDAPFNAYGADGLYVSPMKSDLARFLSCKNPLFHSEADFTYFAVKNSGRAIGRISAHVHQACNQLHSTKRACFGFFDCANDPETAAMLLAIAESWARVKGLTRLIGNCHLTAMHQAGVAR